MYKTHKRRRKLFYLKESSCPRQLNANLHKQASTDIVSAIETDLFIMKSSWSWQLVNYKGPNEMANHWSNNVMNIREICLHFCNLYTIVWCTKIWFSLPGHFYQVVIHLRKKIIFIIPFQIMKLKVKHDVPASQRLTMIRGKMSQNTSNLS